MGIRKAAVVAAFEWRMMEIAEAIETFDGKEKEKVYKELITSVTATMTDQGPTMPQFSEQMAKIRDTLLPSVIESWQIYLHMCSVPARNLELFIVKCIPLSILQMRSTRLSNHTRTLPQVAKNCTLFSQQKLGVTRLVQTASKAFHHRGPNKSGVEDKFSKFVEREYGEKNRLVYYVGNMVNILFEGAASTLLNKHIISFVKSLPAQNVLLQAVYEDSEDVHIAELKALGITILPLPSHCGTRLNHLRMSWH